MLSHRNECDKSKSFEMKMQMVGGQNNVGWGADALVQESSLYEIEMTELKMDFSPSKLRNCFVDN